MHLHATSSQSQLHVHPIYRAYVCRARCYDGPISNYVSLGWRNAEVAYLRRSNSDFCLAFHVNRALCEPTHGDCAAPTEEHRGRRVERPPIVCEYLSKRTFVLPWPCISTHLYDTTHKLHLLRTPRKRRRSRPLPQLSRPNRMRLRIHRNPTLASFFPSARLANALCSSIAPSRSPRLTTVESFWGSRDLSVLRLARIVEGAAS